MKATKLPTIALLATLAISQSAHAAVTITNTGSRNNTSFTSAGTATNPTNTLATLDFSNLTSTANTAVFFVYEYDGGNSSAGATFAGQTMNIERTDRVVIGWLAAPTNKSGDIKLFAGTGDGNELAYWGLAEGIDTTDITTAVGTAINTTTDIQTNATLSNLSVGDVVISGFAVNNFAAAAYSDGLVTINGSSTQFDGKIASYTVGTAGSFSPTTQIADGATLAPGGISIAFTAVIPEPSAALLGSLGALALLRRRR